MMYQLIKQLLVSTADPLRWRKGTGRLAPRPLPSITHFLLWGFSEHEALPFFLLDTETRLQGNFPED